MEETKQESGEVKVEDQKQIVAAIDIGTTKIVAIVGEKNKDNTLRILGMGKSKSLGVKRGVVQNIEKTINSIETAIKLAENEAGVKIEDVFIGIAGQHVRSMRNRGYILRENDENEISQKDIAHLVSDMYKLPVNSGEEILHVFPQSYIVDGEFDVEPIGMHGRKLEGNFHIVIAQTTSEKNIKKCINKVGLKDKGLILEPIASSDAVLTEDEKEVGVVMVDIGGGTSDMAIYYDKKIMHTAVIPFGGDVITKDIKKELGIIEADAERLKVNHGSALPEAVNPNSFITIRGISNRPDKEISQRFVSEIINARMTEIIGAIEYQIELTGLSSKLGAGIVLTGGGAQLENLRQLMAFKTGMDIRIGTPNTLLINNLNEELNKTMYSTSIGLVIRGFDVLENDMIINNIWDKSSNIEEEVEEEIISNKKEKKKEKKKAENEIGFGVKLKDKLMDLLTDKDQDL